MNIRRLTRCALFASVALIIFILEAHIPPVIPVPGFKLGLANVVTLTALYLLGGQYAFAVLLIRCFMGAVFGGGISGLLFSLTGGILAMVTMIFGKKMPIFSVYGVSILGAAAHNIGQILAAMVLLQSPYIAAYLPYLLVVALFTGFAIGAAGAGILRIFKAVHISKEMDR